MLDFMGLGFAPYKDQLQSQSQVGNLINTISIVHKSRFCIKLSIKNSMIVVVNIKRVKVLKTCLPV